MTFFEQWTQNMVAFQRSCFIPPTLTVLSLLVLNPWGFAGNSQEPKQLNVCRSVISKATIRRAESELTGRIAAIQSPNTLTEFLLRLGNYKPEFYNPINKLSEFIWTQYNLDQIQKMVQSLSLSPRHQIANFISETSTRFALMDRDDFVGEHTEIDYYLRMMTKKEKMRWRAIGENLVLGSAFEKKFSDALKTSLDEYAKINKRSEATFDLDSQTFKIKYILVHLGSPVLTGRFVEYFLRGDLLVRHYLLESVIRYDITSEGQMIFTFKEASNVASNLKDAKIEVNLNNVIDWPYEDLEGQAYFFDRSKSKTDSPQFARFYKLKSVLPIALRFAKKYDYDLLQTFEAIKSLGSFLVPNPEIDQTLIAYYQEALEHRENPIVFEMMLAHIASIELFIANRKIHNLNQFDSNYEVIRYLMNFRSENINYLGQFLGLAESVDWKYILQHNPELLKIFRNYFKDYIEFRSPSGSFEDPKEPPVHKKFRKAFVRDFGLS